jgi:DNA-binding response OmpR family regulator
MRVLLVDDEQEFVATLAERLQMRGIEADWCTTAEASLERVANARYDVAVLDVKMPGVSGIDLKAKIQALSPGTRFIFLTGHGSEKDFIAGRSISAYYLIKPVQIDDLVEKLKAAVAGEDQNDDNP